MRSLMFLYVSVFARSAFYVRAHTPKQIGKSVPSVVVVRIIAAKRLFKICCFTIGAPRAVIVSGLRGSLRLHSFFAQHTIFLKISVSRQHGLKSPNPVRYPMYLV